MMLNSCNSISELLLYLKLRLMRTIIRMEIINSCKHLDYLEYFLLFLITDFLWGFRSQMKLLLISSTVYSSKEGASLENIYKIVYLTFMAGEGGSTFSVVLWVSWECLLLTNIKPEPYWQVDLNHRPINYPCPKDLIKLHFKYSTSTGCYGAPVNFCPMAYWLW